MLTVAWKTAGMQYLLMVPQSLFTYYIGWNCVVYFVLYKIGFVRILLRIDVEWTRMMIGESVMV